VGSSVRMLSWRVRTLSTPRYWRVRSRLTNLRGASAFAIAQSGSYVRESRSTAWLLAKSFGHVGAAVALAIAIVASAQVLGTYLQNTVANWPWLPTWLSVTASWFGKPPPPGMNYQAIVAAALAVTGTLAGVYFATVAFVVSTTYKDATSEVRALVTRLPGGRVYATVFVQAVLFGLITLMLPMIGRQPNRLSLCIVTVLGGFVVLSFGRLRTQLYGLLEPVGLLPMVQRDLNQLTAQASRLVGRDPTGIRTRLSRARTFQSLRTLRDLCYLIRDRERRTENVPAEYAGTDPRVLHASQYVLAIWLQYARRKQVLVQLTDWCPQRISHKDWLLASNSEVGIALATATTLQAGATNDLLWVERQLAEVLRELLGGREVPQLGSILGSLDDPVRGLVSLGMFAESRLWLEAVVSPARAASMAATPAPSADAAAGETSKQTKTRSTSEDMSASAGHFYNLVDLIALAYIQAVLGLHDYAGALTTDFPEWMVAQARGKGTRNLSPLPAALLKNLRDGLSFELAVEGRQVTSDANIMQLVAFGIATEAIDEATALLAVFEDDFWPWASHVVDRDTPAAGAALSRMDEALRKWDLALSALSTLFDQCEAVHRDVDDRWPDLSLDGLAARLATLRVGLRVPIAKIATRVDVDVDPDRPDVFGWAFYRTHQDLLEDVLSDRTPVQADLEERLHGLLAATDRASGRLRATVRRQHDRVLGAVWSEPLLMLLQLSGVALVTGLVRQKSDLLDVFERAWARLLDADSQHVLDVASAALAADDALFALSTGKINRSNRHLQATSALEELGVSRDAIEDGDLGGSHPELSTRLAAMLRYVAYGDFEDVFMAAWLVPEARRRGATLSNGSLGPRLSGLIATLADAAADENSRQAESSVTDARDHGEGAS
jgi:hypothetical protein